QPELKGRPVVLYGPARQNDAAPAGRSAAPSTARSGNWQVRHCSQGAVAAGVHPEMPLAEAQALLEWPVSRGRGTAHFTRHDPEADRKLLQALAGWCARYSPLVGMEQVEEPGALFLDISGCAPLFGGEERMAAQVVRDFERAGYTARIVIADTIGAAWATVRFGGNTINPNPLPPNSGTYQISPSPFVGEGRGGGASVD